MTEAEWKKSTNPVRMLEYLRRCRRYSATARKLRLYACRCVRRIRKRLVYQESDDALKLSERFAEGEASWEEMIAARRDAREAISSITQEDGGESARRAARAAWCLVRMPNRRHRLKLFTLDMAQAVVQYVCPSRYSGPPNAAELIDKENGIQARILREMVGNPYRPIVVEPEWLTPTVLDLANVIYRDRTFDAMPILSDALEDAGCASPAILNHLRASTRHYRGCHVLDALLDKE